MTTSAFAHKKFSWLERITRDHDLHATDVRVAAAIMQHFNEKDQGGRAFPGYKFLADKIAASENTVIGAVRRLRERGHLRVIAGKAGAGHSNSYWMAAGKPATAAGKKNRTGDRFSKRENLQSAQKKPAAIAGEPLFNPDDERRLTAAAHHQEGVERKNALAVSALGDAPGATAPRAPSEPDVPLDGEIIRPRKPSKRQSGTASDWARRWGRT